MEAGAEGSPHQHQRRKPALHGLEDQKRVSHSQTLLPDPNSTMSVFENHLLMTVVGFGELLVARKHFRDEIVMRLSETFIRLNLPRDNDVVLFHICSTLVLK